MAKQEMQLSQLAAQEDKDAGELASEVLSRRLATEAHFLAAVNNGQEAARRGEFVESAEVWRSVERILQT